MPQRSFGRTPSQTRPISITPNFLKNAKGSALCEFGNTRVLCAVSIEESVPNWLRGTRGHGWLTAEYSMLPASTPDRTRRDRNGVPGRSQEIQRLIGRSLRGVVDLRQLGERTITIDCDVIEADAGTRVASITGAYVALKLAIARLIKEGKIKTNPIKDAVAAVSVAMVEGEFFVDPDYSEDQRADLDLNVVMTASGQLLEVQGTAERRPYSREQLNSMLDLAQNALSDIFEEQSLACERNPNEAT